jgi:hypothetical protein
MKSKITTKEIHMLKKTILITLAFLVSACGSIAAPDAPSRGLDRAQRIEFIQHDVAHTNITMLLPEGWVSEYYQGTTTFASDSQNLFYSPSEPFEGALVNLFVSDGPRAVGPSFDVLQLAQDFVADQQHVAQAPILTEDNGRQIVTARYMNDDAKGKLITYFAGFVMEGQQLTVFLAATPNDTESDFLPVLETMLYSIQIQSSG